MWTKEEQKEYMRAWKETHKEQEKTALQSWRVSHKAQRKTQTKVYCNLHREQLNAAMRADINSFGQTKNSIRCKSRRYLIKYGYKITGYEIHHCCTYTEPYKFIYCSREMHKLIHSYLRQYNIDADSDHYEQIKHLLDDTVVKYGID